jgi:hypothetical protein
MARGQDTGNHPGRSGGRGAFDGANPNRAGNPRHIDNIMREAQPEAAQARRESGMPNHLAAIAHPVDPSYGSAPGRHGTPGHSEALANAMSVSGETGRRVDQKRTMENKRLSDQ